jgi:predicted Ser/Thr protein kinase
MRISILEKREDFYHILSKTLSEWNPPHDSAEENSVIIYFVNKYLNFIAHPELSEILFSNLVAEYGTSTIQWKRFFQKTYVKLAVSKRLRGIFSHKSIELPQRYASKLILGGNHRIRIFQDGLISSTVILKKGEDTGFISNEVNLRTSFPLDYAPKLLNFGDDWLEEEYIIGLPLNRLNDYSAKQTLIQNVISLHFNQLIKTSKVQVSAKEYLETKQNKLNQKLFDPQLRINKDDQDEIVNTFQVLVAKVTDKEIPISWTHGDFQEGNVLVNEGSFKVIDWEAADKRFSLYDVFVLKGNIRGHGNFKQALETYMDYVKAENELIEVPFNWLELLMMEEILYNVNEDCSVNYYQSGEKTIQLCEQINKILQA